MFLRKQPPEVFFKKLFLEISQNLQESTRAGVSFLIKLEANTFFTEHLLITTSDFVSSTANQFNII